jgi:hypothetical protein
LFLAATGKQQACHGEGENRGGRSVDFHNGYIMPHSGAPPLEFLPESRPLMRAYNLSAGAFFG